MAHGCAEFGRLIHLICWEVRCNPLNSELKGGYEMKYFKQSWLLFFVIAFYLLVFMSPGAKAEQKGDKNVRFRWAFGAMIGPKNDRRLVAITRDTTLKTGDQLKMFVELKKKCFVYVIYLSGQDEMELLFPYELAQFATDYETSRKYYVPKEDMWFELDKNAGRETFYLLASAKRLTGLEALLGGYKRAKADNKLALAEKIVAEIRNIKKRNRKFTTAVERPVQIGGNVRGIDKDKKRSSPDIDPIAAEVSATNFYGRTFTIDHQ